MPRNAVTDRYLRHADRRGLGHDDIPTAVRGAADIGPTTFRDTCLSRPAFLDRAERETLTDDIRRLHTALGSLPDLLFGGDLAAFARAARMTDAQVGAIERAGAFELTPLARGDLFHDGQAFRLLELNLGSTVGGLDNAVVNRAALTHPALAEFVTANGLDHVDTLGELAAMLVADAGIADGATPRIVAVDWPDSFVKIESLLRASAAALGAYGVDIDVCHLGQLEHKDDRVWLDGRVVDVVYRVFMLEDMLAPEGPGLIDPVLRAAERGTVSVFTPLGTELFGSKAALAILSDEANRGLFGAADLASLDRLLPWTRVVRDEDVTFDGERAGLLDVVLARRPEMVLKPALLHGGLGVTMGWLLDDDEWAKAVRTALDDGTFVVQRRVRSATEPFPAAGGYDHMRLNWCVFQMATGYGGALVRGNTDIDGGLLDLEAGTRLGPVFHEV